MALPIPRPPGFQSMMKEGAKYFRGLDEAVLRNIEACVELCTTLKTAYGPKGLNKMIVNHLNKLFVTSDAGTIVRELQVEHPAAKIIIMAAERQEQEVGDGTNFVIQLCGALLQRASELIRLGLKPTEIIDGYELAAEKIVDEYLASTVVSEIKDIRNIEQVLPVLKTAICTKEYGHEDFLARLVAQTCISVLPQSQSSGDLASEQVSSFNVDNIRVCKILGSGITESHSINGMVFKKHVEGTHSNVNNAKIAVYSCGVDVSAPESKATVLIKNAEELVNFSSGEEQILEKQVAAIAESGVNVIIAGAKFGDLGLHYCDKYKITAVRLTSRFDLKRICRAIGATCLLKLKPPTADEMGFCDEVRSDEIGGTPVVVFKMNEAKSKISTIIIRGSTDNLMDGIERAVDDGINVFKMLTRDARLVAGAGATELELDMLATQYARTLPGLEQYAVSKFAEALRSVANSIAENAGIRSRDVLNVLAAAHKNGDKYAGIDIEEDEPKALNAKDANLVDLYAGKHWGIKFATSAVCTILQVDQIICAKPAQGPKPPQSKGAAWDDQD